jgi:predicted RNase H-like HicB family nuclease
MVSRVGLRGFTTKATQLANLGVSDPGRQSYAETMPELPRTLTAALHQEEDWYIAQCLEVDVASQGHTIDEALANLAEAVELYLEEVDDPAGHVTATPLVTSFQLPAA